MCEQALLAAGCHPSIQQPAIYKIKTPVTASAGVHYW